MDVSARIAATPGTGAAEAVQEVAGVVFDCDGVLVDSEQPWLDIMAAQLRRLGLADTSPETLRGMTAAEAVAALGSLHAEAVTTGGGSADVRPPHARDIDLAYSAALTDLSAPMPGAPELVRALSGSVPVAVASNGREEDVRGLLERADMLHLFDVVVTIDDVDRGKPAPDPYLLAAARLGVDPRAAVAFEDSVLGSQAAHTAGLTVVGVNEDLSVPLTADLRLRSLREIRFDPHTRTLRT
ncbi:HAD family phosphatase [Brevibacterium salitolerans]|uniref:HAD family phosphatase n=1 Tax=Brevibacterium salitolerans TaxID=1403566 RepID=A0ABN2WSM3_9MICO|nr:HAD family phosphatase [Brevibacterium sp.]